MLQIGDCGRGGRRAGKMYAVDVDSCCGAWKVHVDGRGGVGAGLYHWLEH